MKIILVIIVVLCSTVTYAQDQNANPAQTVAITANIQAIPVATQATAVTVTKSTAPAMNTVTFFSTQSTTAQLVRAAVSEATNTTTPGKIAELNTVSVTLQPAEKPKNTIPVSTLAEQKD